MFSNMLASLSDLKDNMDKIEDYNTWVKFDKAHGAAGDNKVTIDLTPNTNTENARTIVLALTCGEVINLINIRQAAAIPTEE